MLVVSVLVREPCSFLLLLVITSKALVTTSDALVTTSDALVTTSFLLLPTLKSRTS